MIKKTKKAFTITELVIVIAVIAILAAVLIPTFGSVIENSRKSAAMQNCRNAMVAINAEKSEKGEGETADGTVFVNNDYVFVLYNGALQQVGKLADLQKKNSIGADGKIQNGDATITGITLTGKEKGSDDKALTKITIVNDTATLVDEAITGLASTSTKAAENIYFYTITVNGTAIYGAFTYEIGDNTVTKAYYLTSSDVVYSRLATYSTTAITVTALPQPTAE